MDFCNFDRTANHTTQISPEKDSVQILVESLHGLAFGTNLFFGLPANAYILWLILRGGKDKIASDFVPLNQILVEILLCLTGLLYFLERYLSVCFLTILFHVLRALFAIMRPLVQSFICLEQYLAVVHPVMYFRCKSLKFKVACFTVSWLAVVTVSVFGTLFVLHDSLFQIIGIVYCFFWLSMAFCCVSVLRALRRPGPGEGQRGQQMGNKIKRRAFNLILFNLVCTSGFQLPMAASAFFLGDLPEVQHATLASINIFTFVVTGFIPPVLYLYRERKIYSTCKCI